METEIPHPSRRNPVAKVDAMSVYMVSSEARYCLSTLVLAPLAKEKRASARAEALETRNVKTELCPMRRERGPKQ
jgi:hypothetical protein